MHTHTFFRTDCSNNFLNIPTPYIYYTDTFFWVSLENEINIVLFIRENAIQVQKWEIVHW